MKALKEKRISLRSLWRRGLVILSLFALVFASCNSSSDDSKDDGKVEDIVTVTWLTPATRPLQYLGTPVDLTGLVANVTYRDGGTEVVKYEDHPERFYTVPRVVTGGYDNGRGGTVNGTFTGMPSVRIFYRGGEYLSTDVGTGLTDWYVQVIDIQREMDDWRKDYLVTLPSIDNITDTGVYATGFDITGRLRMATKEVYVDDDTFDFAGLAMEALYTDGAQKEIRFEDIQWMILPDYPRATDMNPDTLKPASYPGWVYIMVGADWENVMTPKVNYNQYRYGVTNRVALEKVYTVDKIVYASDEALKPFFFWESNTPQAWAQRLIDANGRLEVTYLGTDVKQTKYIKDLAAKDKIWWNTNPGDLIGDFYVMPLTYPFTTKGNKEPALKVYYRGAWGYGNESVWGSADPILIPVNVFTRLVSISVANKAGTDIGYEYDREDLSGGGQDNDLEDPGYGGNEVDFAEMFTVTARYQAYHNTSLEEPVVLTLIPTFVPNSGVFAAGAASGPYFTTNYDSVRQSVTKEGQTKAVKIWHTVRYFDVEDYLISPPRPEDKQQYTYDKNNALFGNPLDGSYGNPYHIFNGNGQQSKNTNVSVKWHKNL